MATVQAIPARDTSSTWDFFYGLDMALACLISYLITTRVLSHFVAEPDTLLGGMWATVAAMSPQDAWHQPLLRLADTVVGIAIGVACKWIGSFLYFRCVGKPAQ